MMMTMQLFLTGAIHRYNESKLKIYIIPKKTIFVFVFDYWWDEGNIYMTAMISAHNRQCHNIGLVIFRIYIWYRRKIFRYIYLSIN